MSIDAYTSFDEVRAALGVTDDELTNEQLSLDVYAFALEEELYSVSETLASEFLVLKDLPLSTLTESQKKFRSSAKLFSTYSVARHLSDTLQLFAPKTISDGKASKTRFSDSLDKFIQNLEVRYKRSRQQLVADYTAFKSGSSSDSVANRRTFISTLTPNTNPVTNT